MIGTIADEANLTKVQAARALEAFLAGVQTSLVRGDRVTISGFGTFDVSQHKARRVRNPRNGSAVEVRARRVPRFAPAPDFKSAVDR
jgi:DNA-binding protein HU-beta